MAFTELAHKAAVLTVSQRAQRGEEKSMHEVIQENTIANNITETYGRVNLILASLGTLDRFDMGL